MSDKEFCELYNSYTGEGGVFSGIDNPKQLTVHMTGEELKEWTEFALKQANGVTTDEKQCNLPVVSNNEVAVCECQPNTGIYCETVTKCSKCNKEVKIIRTN